MKAREKLLGFAGLRASAVELAPLAVVLIGVALVAFTLGPFETYDTRLEFEAASNVVKMGVPYIQGYGGVIDQPPLGFYVEGAFLATFGLSANTGVVLVTLFGLASTVTMYFLGKEVYGKTAGLYAAALFGLCPWQLILSRTFLIDTQCLFLSLLCFFVGVLAIRKGSVKLAAVSGVVFAAAFFTKFYAAFILLPLLLFYVYSKPKSSKRVLSQIAAFIVPTASIFFLWYQVIRGMSPLWFLHHNDFTTYIPANIAVTPFFATNFLVNYGLGYIFLTAAVFSLVLGFSLRKVLSKTAVFDAIFLATIVFILAVNVFLGAVLFLDVPYFSAVKYGYQAVPFFVLIVASLIPKGYSLLAAATSTQRKKQMFWLAALAAAILFAASLAFCMFSINFFSVRDYLQFRVARTVDYGYSLTNTMPLVAGNPLLAVQFLGFAIVLSGLLWASSSRLKHLFKAKTVS